MAALGALGCDLRFQFRVGIHLKPRESEQVGLAAELALAEPRRTIPAPHQK
jgi:hypothetical protein